MKRTSRGGAAVILGGSIFAALVWMAAIPRESTPKPSSLSPSVSFFHPPNNGDDVPYRTVLSWTGSDPDSGDAIHHYEIAIDPPGVFTSAEIAHPETAPGVTLTVRSSSEEGRDTIEVAKDVADSVYTYFWIGTPDTSESFVFSTPNPDSEFVGGQIQPTDHFSGSHRVFVRAKDMDATISESDSIWFTALNLTPVSTITDPNIASEITDLGPSFLLKAVGSDPDSESTTHQPVGYLVNLVRLDTLEPRIPILQATTEVLFRFGEWVYEAGDSLDKILNVAVPGEYILGVRAVDENGAIDPFLAFGVDGFKFQAFPSGPKPDLIVYESLVGQKAFRGTPSPLNADVPANIELRFSWWASAERYGGEIESYSWGLDIPDPTVQGPESGWSPWGQITSPPEPMLFPSASTHTLYVRVRDVVGMITMAQLILHVIEFPFDREVLLVDDSFDNLSPQDSEHDAFWQDMANYYAANSDVPPEQFFTYSVHGDGDRGNLQADPPELCELARYKVLVWENAGWGYNSDSGLIRCTALSPTLTAYLRAGGKLWLDGRMNVAATTPSPNLYGADLAYPKTELGPGDWAWDFLKLHSTKTNNDKGVSNKNLLHSVWPFPGVPAVYDSMTVEISKLPLLRQSLGGFSHADAVFDPNFAESEPDFKGDIDSLYSYGAAGDEVQGTASQYHGKLCALRWHDPDVAALHGRVQWFGFSLYYMKQDQARKTFQQSLDWLRQDDGIVPVEGLTFAAFRIGSSAVVRWEVAEGGESRVFRLYRDVLGGEREELTTPPFTGKLGYEFVDSTAPAIAVDYWLAEIDRSGSISWHGPMSVGPAVTSERPLLSNVTPNPVTRNTRIEYSLPKTEHVRLTVHDVSGRQVAMLKDEDEDAGLHTFDWVPNRTEHLSAGFYIIRLRAGGVDAVRKVLVLP